MYTKREKEEQIMQTKKALDYLRTNFPEAAIELLPKINPTEIIGVLPNVHKDTINPPELIGQCIAPCEKVGVAIAIIDASLPHHHDATIEQYEVLEGILLVYVDGDPLELHEGEKLLILPGQVHFARGDNTKVRVLTSPPWSADDHLFD